MKTVTSEVSVAEIHSAFNLAIANAESKLLNINKDRANILSKLNNPNDVYYPLFNHFKEAREVMGAQQTFKTQSQLLNESKKVDEFLKELEVKKMAMPYRLINYHAVMSLCAKYGLVLGQSSRYKETLPEVNAAHVSNFISNYSNRRKDGYSYETYWLELLTKPLFSQEWKRNSWSDQEQYLYMVAPLSYFNTKSQMLVGNELINSPGIDVVINYTAPIPPDPIVLAPVAFKSELGIDLKICAIVTAFGVEANDSKVVNPKMN